MALCPCRPSNISNNLARDEIPAVSCSLPSPSALSFSLSHAALSLCWPRSAAVEAPAPTRSSCAAGVAITSSPRPAPPATRATSSRGLLCFSSSPQQQPNREPPHASPSPPPLLRSSSQFSRRPRPCLLSLLGSIPGAATTLPFPCLGLATPRLPSAARASHQEAGTRAAQEPPRLYLTAVSLVRAPASPATWTVPRRPLQQDQELLHGAMAAIVASRLAVDPAGSGREHAPPFVPCAHNAKVHHAQPPALEPAPSSVLQ
nr:wiskott-Aldrich syndrome protein homolog 1 isoform X2 [Aegilops tauschii subsp. strangulata]